MSEPQYAIAVDFDGVIHRYDSPWKSATHIPDPPVSGAFGWIAEMVEHYHVIIHSTRCKEVDGPSAMVSWFKKHGMPEKVIQKLFFHAEKPAALLYIDDRGWQFNGEFPTLAEVKSFRPWNKRGEK